MPNDVQKGKSFDVELFSITATYIHEQWLKITHKVSFYAGNILEKRDLKGLKNAWPWDFEDFLRLIETFRDFMENIKLAAKKTTEKIIKLLQNYPF